MRNLRLVLLLFVFVIVLGLVTATGSRSAVQAQGQNLLTNPDFEAGVYTFDPDEYGWVALYATQREDCRTSEQYLPCNTAQVPLGWIPWWISQTDQDPEWKNRMPEYKPATPPFMNRIHSGNMAAQYFTFHGTHTAGLLQVVNVPANAPVRFTIFGQAWSSVSDTDYSDFPTSVNMRIGIDPTGSTNPYSPAIVWSDYKQPYDAYTQFSVEATAQGDTVTVFTISSPDEARKHNDIYWDSASLVALGAGSAPPPPPPAATSSSGNSGSGGTSGGSTGGTSSSGSDQAVAAAPSIGPTATPNAEGVIMAEVQTGDSFWSIAARHGISVDELYELNDAEAGDFIQVGQMLIVGYAEPDESAEAAEEEEAALAAAEEEATPRPTPEPPTATPTPAPDGGEVCVLAYEDENANGDLESGETLKSAVAFTIYNEQEVMVNYVTDGVSEPYCITLETGSYRITRSRTANEELTTPGERAVDVADGMTSEYAFGSTTAEDTAVAAVPEEGSGEATANDAAAALAPEAQGDAADGGIANILVIAAVVVAVLLFVGVLVVILSGRRSTV